MLSYNNITKIYHGMCRLWGSGFRIWGFAGLAGEDLEGSGVWGFGALVEPL